jgi:glyoxylase-like metal-dependent hydrolase (beta-lactamase superfamily II)
MEGRDPTQVIRSRVLTFVVRSQGKTILLDAGVGGWGLWRFGDGHLLESLAELGVSPHEVDYVIPSHLHLDHIGWNTHPGPDGQPVITFPNARYVFHIRPNGLHQRTSLLARCGSAVAWRTPHESHCV